jgi:hypothetical protein
MDLVNNYIYILEIPINIISKLRSFLRQNFNSTTQKGECEFALSFLVLLLESHNR